MPAVIMAEEILAQAGCSPGVIAHCAAVAQLAAEIAGAVTVPFDQELVRLGGMLHDIGRSRTHGIDHAVVGGEIGRALGFDDRIVRIIERHIGAGITAAEAERLGLPKRDYLPLTVEEKIVSYADNLVSGTAVLDFERALGRFRDILGPDHEGVDLFIRQHREIRGWMKP
jgi:uncharacterized protein